MKKLILTVVFCWSVGLLHAAAAPVWLHTQDGWDLFAVYSPAQPEQKTVVLLHDIGQSNQAYSAFMEKLAVRGMGYLALDLRGHGQSNKRGNYTSFAKEGVDNEYNQMTRDVNAAIEFLENKSIAEHNIILIGAGMGANVAAKASTLWPDIGGLALLTPVTNFRDVLPIPALRVYKGLVFIAAAADDKKTFLEASILRNVAFLTSGEGKVTFATAYDKKGHELLNTWVAPELLQWLQTPQKPAILPDVVESEEITPAEGYEKVEASSTEEALFPSVLQ